MKPLITPVGAVYLFMSFMNGMVALMMLVYAVFPAIIGVVAVDGAMKNEDGAMEALVLMAASSIGIGGVGLFIGVLALAYLAAGLGIVWRKRWSRMLGVVLALPLMGVCIPFGTIVGVLALVVLISQEAVAEFNATA